jgi:hypothetical protein
MLAARTRPMRSGLSKGGMAALLAVLILFAVGLGWARRASVKPIVDKETAELKATEREMWDTVNSANGVVPSPAPIVSQADQAARPEPKTAAARQRLAEAAEQEHRRRFAPEGVLYNLKPLKIGPPNHRTVVAAESELMLVKRNEDGTIRVNWRGFEANVSAEDVTNDRDWLAAYHNLHRDDPP